jgi:hypothetical protein
MTNDLVCLIKDHHPGAYSIIEDYDDGYYGSVCDICKRPIMFNPYLDKWLLKK